MLNPTLYWKHYWEWYLRLGFPTSLLSDREQGGLSRTAAAAVRLVSSRLVSGRGRGRGRGRGSGNTCLRNVRADTIFLEKILKKQNLFFQRIWKIATTTVDYRNEFGKSQRQLQTIATRNGKSQHDFQLSQREMENRNAIFNYRNAKWNIATRFSTIATRNGKTQRDFQLSQCEMQREFAIVEIAMRIRDRIAILNYERCPWGRPPIETDQENVQERALKLLDQYRKKSTLYRTNTLLVPLGDDFRYVSIDEAEVQPLGMFGSRIVRFPHVWLAENLIPEEADRINYSLPREIGSSEVVGFPSLSDDFFTYADRQQDYWSGYYVSRPFFKAFDRVLVQTLRASEILMVFLFGYCQRIQCKKLPIGYAYKLTAARRNSALFQHHDGVTGTAKNHVVLDYGIRMHTSLQDLQIFMSKAIEVLLGIRQEKSDQTPAQFDPEQMRSKDDAPPVHRAVSAREGTIQSVSQVSPDLQHDKSKFFTGRHRVHWKASVPAMGDVVEIENPHQTLTFDVNRGLLQKVIQKSGPQIVVAEEVSVYSITGGAYLFVPEGEAVPIIQSGGHLVISEGPLMQEGNYYPMPSLAFMQGSNGQRFSFHSQQSLGAASLKQGWLEIMLDRRLAKDDGSGLGQGVLDNRVMIAVFHLLLETNISSTLNPVSNPQPLSPSLLSHCVSAQLNHPLHAFIAKKPQDISVRTHWRPFSPLTAPLPFDLHIVSFKVPQPAKYSQQQLGDPRFVLMVHRRNWDPSYCPKARSQCTSMADEPVNLCMFNGLEVLKVKPTSLNLLHDDTEMLGYAEQFGDVSLTKVV
ncbi:Alpha-mannosidase 2 [Hibiscus syriacus]|uniref:Alpha-mannosidase 2 n=1 Tax=Hibiscus syriacus TaxID=106335 RepID=A0A6A3BJE8_HIBSY|nr:Alpha-mannosidase 2 [Hibiscus syriacus]